MWKAVSTKNTFPSSPVAICLTLHCNGQTQSGSLASIMEWTNQNNLNQQDKSCSLLVGLKLYHIILQEVCGVAVGESCHQDDIHIQTIRHYSAHPSDITPCNNGVGTNSRAKVYTILINKMCSTMKSNLKSNPGIPYFMIMIISAKVPTLHNTFFQQQI